MRWRVKIWKREERWESNSIRGRKEGRQEGEKEGKEREERG